MPQKTLLHKTGLRILPIDTFPRKGSPRYDAKMQPIVILQFCWCVQCEIPLYSISRLYTLTWRGSICWCTTYPSNLLANYFYSVWMINENDYLTSSYKWPLMDLKCHQNQPSNIIEKIEIVIDIQKNLLLTFLSQSYCLLDFIRDILGFKNHYYNHWTINILY